MPDDEHYARMTLPSIGCCRIIADDIALMDEDYFRCLMEYSTSIPTGKFLGKRWKAKYRSGAWCLHEYVVDNDPKMVGIATWAILVVPVLHRNVPWSEVRAWTGA